MTSLGISYILLWMQVACLCFRLPPDRPIVREKYTLEDHKQLLFLEIQHLIQRIGYRADFTVHVPLG